MQRLTGQILADEPYWGDVFKELSNVVPANIYFTELKMAEQVISMYGVVLSGNPRRALSRFIFSLERGIFKDVYLVDVAEITGKAAGRFELRCWVD